MRDIKKRVDKFTPRHISVSLKCHCFELLLRELKPHERNNMREGEKDVLSRNSDFFSRFCFSNRYTPFFLEWYKHKTNINIIFKYGFIVNKLNCPTFMLAPFKDSPFLQISCLRYISGSDNIFWPLNSYIVENLTPLAFRRLYGPIAIGLYLLYKIEITIARKWFHNIYKKKDYYIEK